jgi:hypothetical protein
MFWHTICCITSRESNIHRLITAAAARANRIPDWIFATAVREKGELVEEAVNMHRIAEKVKKEPKGSASASVTG